MFEHFSPLLLVWAFTYFIHSSLLITIAYLIDRAGLLNKTRCAELVWRFALFGALLTASTQIYLTSTAKPTKTSIASVQLGKQNNGSAIQGAYSLSPLSYPLPDQLVSEQTLATPLPTGERFTRTPVEISLPQTVKSTTSYLVYAWLMIAMFGCLTIYRSARHLNRLAAFFPEADKKALKRLLNKVKETEQSRIQLKISDQWNSPFVTPDNTICIPRWAYIKLSEDQRDAMLAHEVAHVLRRDPAWRLAMQILNRVCFFQPLHMVAIRRLELLAELACDEHAAQASGKPQELAEALYTCAKIAKSNNAPDLALAMSRQGSPLLKRITSLLDQDLLAKAAIPQTRSARLMQLGFLTVSLVLVMLTTPNIVIHFEKGIPSLRSIATDVKQFAQEVKRQALLPRSDTEPSFEPSKLAVTPLAVTLPQAQLAQELSAPMTQNINQPQPEIITDNQNEVTLAEANRLRDKKDWQKARQSYLHLAERGNVDAQLALGELSWKGLGQPSNVAIATEWFKRAAVNGSNAAEKYLSLINEREKHLADIAYYTEHYDGKEWSFGEMKCIRPDFGTTLQSSVDIEYMIYQVNEFAACFNRYGERLNASKLSERVLPNAVLRLMTDEEIEKAINRNIRVMATIRLTANLIAEDFTTEKQNWELRLREQFKGARSRDWMSLKRVAIANGADNDQASQGTTKLVKIDTSVELISNLSNLTQ